MRRQHGFSLVELMAALMILTLIVMTTLAIFFDRRKHLQLARETILAYQALQNESEIWRRVSYGGLEAEPPVFHSDTALLAPLEPYTTAVAVLKNKDNLKTVTFTIRWHQGERVARLGIVRSDTGGNGFW